MEKDLDKCFITGTKQLSDLEPALALAILSLPLFSTPKFMKTPDVRLEPS